MHIYSHCPFRRAFLFQKYSKLEAKLGFLGISIFLMLLKSNRFGILCIYDPGVWCLVRQVL